MMNDVVQSGLKCNGVSRDTWIAVLGTSMVDLWPWLAWGARQPRWSYAKTAPGYGACAWDSGAFIQTA